MTIRGEDLLIMGAWGLLVGSLIDTIGQTQQTLTGTDLGKDLIIKGNGIESFGNSLQAIGRTKLLPPEPELSEIYSILGCWLEAAGNSTNAIGVEIEVNVSEDEGIKIDTLGSGVQALGAAFEAVGASLTEDSSFRSLSIKGNSFISLGSLLESIGNIFVINNKTEIGEQILLVGSWIQVIGSFILVHAITLEVESISSSKIESSNLSYYNYNTR
ncbi:hypothetical protein ABEV54_13220 [Peribacillus psychrosaccharolyticus]|uniref:DUF6944 family repetitive protein n=1 Tax=Peribacillus psychrosaccharolyticus TaxID=1407 RepID=UPI003D2A8DF1